MTSTTDLVPAPAAPVASALPLHTGAEMARAFSAYREIQAVLDREMADQIINLDGKPFRRKGYWLAISVAFNVSVELVEEQRHVYGSLGDGTENFAYVVNYRASMAGGRSQIGDGACSVAEKSKGRMKATEHNVRSHAHTRARNRAISNLVGFGEVSAEEVEDLEPSPGGIARAGARVEPGRASASTPSPAVLDSELPAAAPTPGAHLVYVTDVTKTATRNPNVFKFTLTIAGGPDWPANQNTVSTISKKVAELARECKDAGAPVRLRTKSTQYGFDVVALERMDDQGQPLPLTAGDIPFR